MKLEEDMIQSDGARLLWKIYFCQNLDKKGQKNRAFWTFLKILSLIFPKAMQNENYFDS